jgi:phosphoglycerate dehydrogenase-like enzyme
MGYINDETSSTSKGKDILLVAHALGETQDALLDDLHKTLPHLKVVLNEDPIDKIPTDILKATKYLLTFNHIPTPEQTPNLKFIQLFSAGSNHAQKEPLWKWKLDDVKWCSASGVHGPIIGEYVVMAALTHFHKYLSYIDSFQGVGHWPTQHTPNGPQRELYHQTVGIVGYGAIGRNVAKLLTGFNLDVVTLNSSPKDTSEKRRQSEGYTVPGTGDVPGDIPSKWYTSSDPEEKKKFFESSDVVVVTAPYTPATKHLVDATALGYMKKTALLINVARGELVDQDALIAALEKKEIGGAALDVLTPEPYPATGDLLKKGIGGKDDRERLVLTPHISGHTNKYTERVVEILRQNIHRLAEGKPLLNVIDRRKGY